MRYTSLLPAFLASTLVSASPVADESLLDNLAEGEVHVFKRDVTTITPRDIELAKRDGVDPAQMYRHSMVKRDDGDHVTIWVDNSYVERDQVDGADAKFTKRQSYRILTTGWGTTDKTRECSLTRASSTGDTGPNAPTTGGANAIIRWSNTCNGAWRVAEQGRARDLIVAGSNGGWNMRFTARSRRDVDGTVVANMGCRDVGLLVEQARDRYEISYNGVWRVRARGVVECDTHGWVCYKTHCGPTKGERNVDWWMDNFNGRV